MLSFLIPREISVLEPLLVPMEIENWDVDFQVQKYIRIKSINNNLIAEVTTPHIYAKMTVTKEVLNYAHEYNIRNITEWNEVFLTKEIIKQLQQIKYPSGISFIIKNTLAQIIKIQKWSHKTLYEYWRVGRNLQDGITIPVEIGTDVIERFDEISKRCNNIMNYTNEKSDRLIIKYKDMQKLLKVIKNITTMYKLETNYTPIEFRTTMLEHTYWTIQYTEPIDAVTIEGLLV